MNRGLGIELAEKPSLVETFMIDWDSNLCLVASSLGILESHSLKHDLDLFFKLKTKRSFWYLIIDNFHGLKL